MENTIQSRSNHLVTAINGNENQATFDQIGNTDQIEITEQICGNQTILNYGNDIQIIIVGDINADDVILIEDKEHLSHNQLSDQPISFIEGESVTKECLDDTGVIECLNIDHDNLLFDVQECTQMENNLEGEKKQFEILCEKNIDVNSVNENRTNNILVENIAHKINNMEKEEFGFASEMNKNLHKGSNEKFNDCINQPSRKSVPGTYKNNDNVLRKAESSNIFKQSESVNKVGRRPQLNKKIPKYFCPICKKSFTSIWSVNRHKKTVHEGKRRKKENENCLKNLKCNYCFECFDDANICTEHYRNVHKRAPPPYLIFEHTTKCLECEESFSNKHELRFHLAAEHNLDMTPIRLRFYKIEAFLEWKCKIERETLTIFHRRRGKGKEDTSVEFECSRNGKSYIYKRKTPVDRMNRYKTNRLGICCTNGILVERKRNYLLVTYYPTHYGHGNEMKIAKLSAEEEAAVEELTSKGMSFEKLIKDLKGADYMDINHLYPLKKRYLTWVKNEFESEEYDSGLSDAECLSQWIQKCCQLEEVPILLCEQKNIGCENEKFILVIMTEFQKQIFMSSSKEIICVDTHFHKFHPHLMIVSVMDELNTAFPVSYCITNKINKDVMTEFFTCIKESVGNLSPKYLVSSYYDYIYESWISVMGYNPAWLWSRFSLEVIIRAQLAKSIKRNPSLKCELFNLIQVMMDCKSEDVFICLFKNFINRLENDKNTEQLAKWIMKWFGANTEKWAHCYQREIDCATNLHFELLYRMFFACGRRSKNKKLYTLIIVIMKILRRKILDRMLNSFDSSKEKLALNSISLCHDKGLTIPPNSICSLSDKLWMIELKDSDKEYVTQEVQKCPDHCCLKCYECNVCVHQFSCSCMHSIINANLCMHVHAVVFKFLGPFKDPDPPENIECDSDTLLDSEDSICQDNDSISVQSEVPIPALQTFTSVSKLKSSNTVLNSLPCKSNSLNDALLNNRQSEINMPQSNVLYEINTPLNNLPCKINQMSNTPMNDIPNRAHILTTSSLTPLTFNSPSHSNVQKNSFQTGISSLPSQIVNNVTQSNISNTASSNFAMNISNSPKIPLGVPILNTQSSNLSKGTLQFSIRKNQELLEKALCQSTEIHHSILCSNLKEKSLAEVIKHLDSCQEIIKNYQHSS